MADLVSWQEWIKRFESERAFPYIKRAIATLVADERIGAVWVSGSRVTGLGDQFSDIDLRVFAPAWGEEDLTPWLHAVDPLRRATVRLSKLAGIGWNYECVFFGGDVPIDLLVLTTAKPVVSSDSVVLKTDCALQHETSLKIIKEAPVTVEDLRNLIDGVAIDQRKFVKLLDRGDRLAASFLMEAQRLALLRLAFIATRGVDCGGRQYHTLASLKLAGGIIRREATPPIAAAIDGLTRDGTLMDNVNALAAAAAVIVAAARARFSELA